MATFHPNPDAETNEPWIERSSIENSFRIWHLMLFGFVGFTAFVVLFCCCVKIRIPRTKQEIEANYQRKKLVSEFKERIKLIENHQMDALDLRKVLEIIQEDYQRKMEQIKAKTDTTNDHFPATSNILLRFFPLKHQHSSNTLKLEAI